MVTLLLQKLSFENFKGFSGEHEFNLGRTPGLYYVTGVNKLNPELGANGVGKSTLWDALFWVLWNKTIRDARPANAIHPWETEKGTTWVTLSFSRLGRSYTLTRSRRPNALTVTNRDKCREIGQDEVRSLIGMSEETFRRTVVLGQFGSLFLDLPPERQAGMFAEALDLGVWLRASDMARDRRNGHAGDAERLRGEVSRLEGRLEEVRGQLAAEEAASSGYERKKAEQIQGLREQAGKNVEETQKIAKEIKGLYDSVPELPRSPRNGGKVSPLLPPLRSRIAGLRQVQRELVRKIGDGEGKLQAMGARRGDLGDRANSYREALRSNRRCPECGQKVEAEHLRGKLAEAQGEIKKINLDLSVAGEDIAEDVRALGKLDREIGALETVATRLESLASGQTLLEASLKRVADETNPHEGAITHIKARRSATKEQLKTEREKLAAAEKSAETCEYWVGAFKEIRLSIVDEVLRELEMAVTRHAGALGLADWRVEFATERTTASGSVSVAFTILLYPPDLEEPVRFESYSGGESQRLQLAVAFGLSEVLLERAGVSPSCEILDEPTKGLSMEGVEELLEHLRERALELNRAIFFTDHHSLDRGAFDGVITVVKDAEGAHIS